MRKIGLTRGKEALVDDGDFWFIIDFSWYAIKGYGRVWYAGHKPRDGPMTLMHRLILTRKLGHSNFEQVDHIDGDGLNNQRENLRPVTNKQNGENLRGAYKNSKSGIRGVSWSNEKKKWRVKLGHNGKHIHIGYFNKLEDAEIAAITARDLYFTHHKVCPR